MIAEAELPRFQWLLRQKLHLMHQVTVATELQFVSQSEKCNKTVISYNICNDMHIAHRVGFQLVVNEGTALGQCTSK